MKCPETHTVPTNVSSEAQIGAYRVVDPDEYRWRLIETRRQLIRIVQGPNHPARLPTTTIREIPQPCGCVLIVASGPTQNRKTT